MTYWWMSPRRTDDAALGPEPAPGPGDQVGRIRAGAVDATPATDPDGQLSWPGGQARYRPPAQEPEPVPCHGMCPGEGCRLCQALADLAGEQREARERIAVLEGRVTALEALLAGALKARTP